jgi:hypothetical protein
MASAPQTPHPPGAASGPEEISKDALRIQAAAVAAQQVALADEEARLEQRREALEQQQEQLAARLEHQRQQLLRLREEAQTARLAQQKERAAFDASVARTREDLEKAQREILAARDQALQERQRLIDLRQRLKRRWHRHWMAQRQALEDQGRALTLQGQRLDRKQRDLTQQRADLDQQRRRAAGEIELGKRQLQESWNQLRQEQEALSTQRQREQSEHQQRAQALGQSEAGVAQAQQELAGDQQRWQETRLRLEREIEGLEARAVNLRRKLQEQQSPPGSSRPTAPEPVVAALPRPSSGDTQLQRERDNLFRLAEDLADQRAQLVEQWERLARTQQRWEREREAATAELQGLAERLPQREQAILAQEQRQQALAGELQRQQWELLQGRHHLEARQIRLQAEEAAWQARRDRVLADARSRQQSADRLEGALVELRGRWARRRKEELEHLRAEYTAVQKLRQEWLARNDEFQRRTVALEKQERLLKNKELALEDCRQQLLTGSPDAAAAERTLQRLERRWAKQQGAALRALENERQRLQVQAHDLQTRFTELRQQSDLLLQQEARLAESQGALELQDAQVRAREIRMQEQCDNLQAQRKRVEQHNRELQEDVERLAVLLMQEPGENLPRIGQAA